MQEYFIARASVSELLRHMGEDVRTFFKQEIKLVKAEMSEKVSKVGRDAMVLGIGNLMAGAGSILLLAGLGFLLAFALQTTGLNTLLAACLGFAIIGLAAGALGAAIGIKGIKAISKDSLAPQRTIHTVTGGETSSPDGHEPSAAELHREALDTKHRIGEERKELKGRLTHLTKYSVEHIRKHPLPWSAAALACALAGSYFVGRKFWRT